MLPGQGKQFTEILTFQEFGANSKGADLLAKWNERIGKPNPTYRYQSGVGRAHCAIWRSLITTTPPKLVGGRELNHRDLEAWERDLFISSSLCLTLSFPAVSWNTQADGVMIRSLVAH